MKGKKEKEDTSAPNQAIELLKALITDLGNWPTKCSDLT